MSNRERAVPEDEIFQPTKEKKQEMKAYREFKSWAGPTMTGFSPSRETSLDQEF
jgi:hypothetical protein